MSKTKLALLLLTLITLTTFLAGCTQEKHTLNNKKPQIQYSIYGDFLHNAEKIQQLKKTIQEKTNNDRIFSNSLTLYPQAVQFSSPNPDNPNTVDQITFQNNQWAKNTAIKVPMQEKTGNNIDNSIATAENIAAFSWHINQLDWRIIPKTVHQAKQYLSEQQITDLKLISVTITKTDDENYDKITVYFQGDDKTIDNQKYTGNSANYSVDFAGELKSHSITMRN